MPLIATESGGSWPGAWSSIRYRITKQGEVIGCKEGHKVMWQGSRVTDLECHVPGFLKQPAGISHVLHSNKAPCLGYVCKDPSLRSPIKSQDIWRSRGEEAESRTDHPPDAATEEPGTCGVLSYGILTYEAAHDSTIPRRGRKWPLGLWGNQASSTGHYLKCTTLPCVSL